MILVKVLLPGGKKKYRITVTYTHLTSFTSSVISVTYRANGLISYGIRVVWAGRDLKDQWISM